MTRPRKTETLVVRVLVPHAVTWRLGPFFEPGEEISLDADLAEELLAGRFVERVQPKTK